MEPPSIIILEERINGRPEGASYSSRGRKRMDLRFDAADVRLALAEEEPDKDGNACESARGIKTANLTVAHYLFSCDGEALVGTRYTFGRITRNDFFSFLLLRFLSLLIIRLVLGCNVLYCTMLFGHASRNRASPYRREVACNKGLNSRLPVSKPPVQLVSRGVVGGARPLSSPSKIGICSPK